MDTKIRPYTNELGINVDPLMPNYGRYINPYRIKTYLATNGDGNFHLNVFDWDNWIFTVAPRRIDINDYMFTNGIKSLTTDYTKTDFAQSLTKT